MDVVQALEMYRGIANDEVKSHVNTFNKMSVDDRLELLLHCVINVSGQIESLSDFVGAVQEVTSVH